MKTFILVIFILLYVLIIALPKYKHYTAAGAAVIAAISCLISGHLTFSETVSGIDFNVIFMLVGIMITVGLFTESDMPNKIADKLMGKISSGITAIVILVVLSGFISAFIDNVATVLMIAPIGVAVAKKIDVSPVPLIIAIAVSSNLQGAATLVGDTTSIMLGGFADMGFSEFFFLDGKPSIFFAVEIGALLTIPVVILLFRKNNKKFIYVSEDIKVKTLFPTVLLSVNIGLLVATSFIPDKFFLTNGIICLVIGIIGIIHHSVKFKKSPLNIATKAVDFETVAFLFFLFIMITCVEGVGIISDISGFFARLGDKNVFLLYTVIVYGSVLLSAFIDNIPYVATMLPVIKTLCLSITSVSPYLLYFGLLCGATLGGNLTPFGASANVVGIGILRREGETVKNSDFFKIGVPFTLVAVTGGYIFCWLVWGI